LTPPYFERKFGDEDSIDISHGKPRFHLPMSSHFQRHGDLRFRARSDARGTSFVSRRCGQRQSCLRRWGPGCAGHSLRRRRSLSFGAGCRQTDRRFMALPAEERSRTAERCSNLIRPAARRLCKVSPAEQQGADPRTGLIHDPAGNPCGTTRNGGRFDCNDGAAARWLRSLHKNLDSNSQSTDNTSSGSVSTNSHLPVATAQESVPRRKTFTGVSSGNVRW
jgi:hypothetical protein